MAADRLTRASDDDREQAVAQLTEHAGAGRLALSEFDERAAAAYSARTLGDLHALFRDLPSAPGPATGLPSPPAAAWSTLAWSTLAWSRPALARAAWWSWAGTGALNLLIWGVLSLSLGELLYFWPGWVIGPWGAVLLVHRVTARQGACS